MTQDWDEILSEPIARLQPDLPAADGGWRGLQPLTSFSPRPQLPPASMPQPEAMLSLRLPEQPEEETAASAPPPQSLTEQLSLTWANRRARRRSNVAETQEPAWPEWTPPRPDEVRPGPPLWQQPLRLLIRLLRREAPTPPSIEADPLREPLPAPQEAVPEPRPGAERAAQAAVQPATRAMQSAPEAELTHVRPPREQVPHEPLEETPGAGETSEPPFEDPTSAPPAGRPGPARPESTLRRWLRRTSPPEAQVHDAPTEATPVATPAEASFPVLALVDRDTANRDAQIQPEAAAPSPTLRPAQAEQPRPQPEDEVGEPLSPVVRQHMETLLDVPLREVRIFRNVVSKRLTAQQNADAVTIGSQVHMASAKGDPSTPSGRALLAHELTHVAQRAMGSEPGPEEETQAQQIEHAAGAAPSRERTSRQGHPSLPLAHRLPPAPASPVLEVAPVAQGAHGFAGFAPPTATPPAANGNGAMAIARAPADRILGTSDMNAGAPIATPDAMAQEDPQKKQQEEANLVDRVVDAVMRRLRRETALERERRGAFHSEIGG